MLKSFLKHGKKLTNLKVMKTKFLAMTASHTIIGTKKPTIDNLKKK